MRHSLDGDTPGHATPHHDHGPQSFDDRASTWDDEETTARARSVAATIAAAAGCTPTTRLLEYGAGTGLVSQFLAPHVGSVILADPSAGMRAVAAEKVASGVLPAGTRILDLNLDVDEPSADRADVIVAVLALHHAADLPRTLTGLGTMLAPGGRLVIVDLEAEDGSFHDHRSDVAHGFDEAHLTEVLRAAGFTTSYQRGIYHIDKNGRPYPLFLAVAERRDPE